MTLSRTFAIATLCFLLFPWVYGQQQLPSPGTMQLSSRQLFVIDSLAADSLRGDLAIPNVFTPNGDGINDFFEVETDGVTVYEFSIFTRTGTRIYYSHSPRIFWDGKSNGGLDLKEGIYYYVIEATEETESIERAGFMHLFR
jgi:gliding motility-associated-like protein